MRRSPNEQRCPKFKSTEANLLKQRLWGSYISGVKSATVFSMSEAAQYLTYCDISPMIYISGNEMKVRYVLNLHDLVEMTLE